MSSSMKEMIRAYKKTSGYAIGALIATCITVALSNDPARLLLLQLTVQLSLWSILAFIVSKYD